MKNRSGILMLTAALALAQGCGMNEQPVSDSGRAGRVS
jgi:hypothetical protein